MHPLRTDRSQQPGESVEVHASHLLGIVLRQAGIQLALGTEVVLLAFLWQTEASEEYIVRRRIGIERAIMLHQFLLLVRRKPITLIVLRNLQKVPPILRITSLISQKNI